MVIRTKFSDSQTGEEYPTIDILLDYKETDRFYLLIKNEKGILDRYHFEVIERMEDIISTNIHYSWFERQYKIMKIN